MNLVIRDGYTESYCGFSEDEPFSDLPPPGYSHPLLQPLYQEFGQSGFSHLSLRLSEVIVNTDYFHFPFSQDYIGSPWIPVPWLSDTACIDDIPCSL